MTKYHVFGITFEADREFKAHLLDGWKTPRLRVRRGSYVGISESVRTQDLLFEGGRKLMTGERSSHLYKVKEKYVVMFGRRICFELGESSIRYGVRCENDEQLIDTCLFGQVLSLWFELQGSLMLHASCVDIGGKAVLFLGGEGGGKTSLAVAFVRAGYPLISDDLVRINAAEDVFTADASYPQVKMTEEQLAYFLAGGESNVKQLRRYFDKYWVPLGDNGLSGEFCSTQRPVARIYVLDRNETDTGAYNAAFQDLLSKEALIALIRGCFLGRIVDATGLQGKRIENMARLVENVPIRRVRYPNGYQYLAKVVRAITNDVKSVPRAGDDPTSIDEKIRGWATTSAMG